MRQLRLKVLPRDYCLAIARLLFDRSGDKSDDELLVYLPRNAFGETFDVHLIAGDFLVYAKDGGKDWAIPPFFVDRVWYE